MLEILQYCKDRVKFYHLRIKYYEALEESRGFLTSDDLQAYNNCLTSVNELGGVINFIDGLLANMSVIEDKTEEE